MASHPNRFLNSLSPESLQLLLSRTAEVDLPSRASLYELDSRPAYAYFLTAGMASIVTSMEDGGVAEVAVVGTEGLIGGMHVQGPGKLYTSGMIQLAAKAISIPLAHLQTAFRTSEEIRDRILEFNQAQTLMISQIAACNRLHEAEGRLARWLLMAQDRTQSNNLAFTQEFLAMMLGSRRTTVTLAAGLLQRAGFIEYSRGNVRILDRENLKATACVCYRITSEIMANLYTSPVTT
jgi:CRP-like cAMP-binding protein